MTILRCAYRHEEFAKDGVYNGNEIDQCWLKEVGNFGTVEAPNFCCIFHAPADLEPIDRRDWPLAERGACQAKGLKTLLEEWNDQNANIPKKKTFALPGLTCGEIDLKEFVFSGNFICTHATFTGKALFASEFKGHAHFREATFTGDAHFEGATFEMLAHFEKATFTREAFFNKSTFTREVIFLEARFSGDARFLEATFTEAANFGEATFTRDAGFKEATFTKDAGFKEARFTGKAVFFETTFEGMLFLENCQFVNPTSSFTKCKIHDLRYTVHKGERVVFNQCESLQENSKLPGIWDFTNQDCSLLSFLNMDLPKADFLGANLNYTRFDSCIWPDGQYGYAQVYRHDEILKKDVPEELRLLQALYQQLKKNLEDARNYRQAGDFHYREMEILRHLLQKQELSLDRGILWMYRIVGDFGENYLKLLVSMISSILLVTGLITLIESLPNRSGIANLIQLFSVLPERFLDGQLGVTLLDIFATLLDFVTSFISVFFKHLKEIILGLIPSPFQKNTFDSLNYHYFSKFLIGIEGLVLVTLSVLFVMAMRRRFRR